jgi:hypothetical protein
VALPAARLIQFSATYAKSLIVAGRRHTVDQALRQRRWPTAPRARREQCLDVICHATQSVGHFEAVAEEVAIKSRADNGGTSSLQLKRSRKGSCA